MSFHFLFRVWYYNETTWASLSVTESPTNRMFPKQLVQASIKKHSTTSYSLREVINWWQVDYTHEGSRVRKAWRYLNHNNKTAHKLHTLLVGFFYCAKAIARTIPRFRTTALALGKSFGCAIVVATTPKYTGNSITLIHKEMLSSQKQNKAQQTHVHIHALHGATFTNMDELKSQHG